MVPAGGGRAARRDAVCRDLVAGCLVVACGACSFTVSGPPPRYSPAEHGEPDCDESAHGRAFVDAIAAGLVLLVPVVVGVFAVAGEVDIDGREAIGLGGLVAVSGVEMGALYHQHDATARCVQARLQYERWHAR